MLCPLRYLASSTDANAVVVAELEVGARGVDARVPLAEVVQGDVLGLGDGPAAVALDDVVARVAVGDDAGGCGSWAHGSGGFVEGGAD